MDRNLYENCRQQNVSSVFGARRVDGTPTINIFCINCWEEITDFYKCLDVWKSNGDRTEYNVLWLWWCISQWNTIWLEIERRIYKGFELINKWKGN